MANAVDTKRTNIALVLGALRRAETVTQPDICKETGLTASTVHGIIAILILNGVILEDGIASSTGGRKAICYTMNHAYRQIIAVSIRLNKLCVGIFDLGINEIARTEHTLNLFKVGSEEYVLLIAKTINEILSEHAIDKKDIAGVSLTLPAPCDSVTGTVHRICGSSQWDSFPLAKRLSGLLDGMSVTIEKDVYAAIDLLYSKSTYEGTSCAAFLSIDGGIGSSLIMGNTILKGEHSIAGEVGHIPVRGDGRKCRCGNTGCLELYCSDTGITELYRAQSEGKTHTIDELINLADSGDELAQQLFSQAVFYLIDAIYALLINYDPSIIIVLCKWLDQKRSLFMKLLQAVYSKSLYTKDHHVEVKLFSKDDYFLDSAANVVARKIFDTIPCALN